MIKTDLTIKQLNELNKNTLMEVLEIEYVEVGDNYVIAKMPVNHKTHQPMGLLHGGASAALIESIGSMGSALCIDHKTHAIVGLEVNANHIKGVSSGYVYANGKLMHQGRRTHLWQVDIKNEQDNLVCTGRLTVMVIEKKQSN